MVETWYTRGHWADGHWAPESGCCSNLSLYLFIFLSPIFKQKFFVKFFSGTERPRKLKLGTHVDNGCMYCIYRN